MKKTISFQDNDSVVVALDDIEKNDGLTINGNPADFSACDQIPRGHKMAGKNIKKGEEVLKYGHVIGRALRDIGRGEHVHIHNLSDSVTEWRGDIGEYGEENIRELPGEYVLENPPELTGFRRKNGMAGFRNHLVVISTTVCANRPVEALGYKYPEIICLTNPSGCVILPNEVERMKGILLGVAGNPNVGAVIFVGLGCESVESEWFYERMKSEKPSDYVRCQSCGSTDGGYQQLEAKARKMLALLKKEKRQRVSISDLRLGTQCGASDWTTAVASNPAIGYCSNLIVKNGGISILGETVGWFGGEEILVRQARTRKVAEDIMALMKDIYNRAVSVGRRIEEGNPTPGNIAGGISTLSEKALGNVRKGGGAPIEGVLKVGESPLKGGLYVSDNPGLDPVSVFALTCSSANMILYSTGRGSPVGTPVAPTIKLTASPSAQEMFGAHNDIDITDVIGGRMSIEEAGHILFKEIIDVANGKQCIAEKGNHREYAFPLLMSPL